MASDIDFATIAEAVARQLWGEPAKGMSTKLGLRWGSGGSKSLDLQTGGWFDHEAHVGGGVIDLVMHVEGVDKPGAIEWLEKNGHIPAREGSHPRQEARSSGPGPEVSPKREETPSAKPKGRWTLIEADAYHSRDGELSYEVCRIQWELPDGSWELGKKGKPRKTFVQRRPSGTADGSKAWGLGEGEYMRSGPGRDWKPFSEEGFEQWQEEFRERGLFLPAVAHTIFHHRELELAIEAGKIILLPEGERKARVAEKLGFGGTTNSGGAANWRDEFAEYFRGADVVIPIDNDDAGRESGEIKANSLRGKAARIRLLDFAAIDPAFKPGFDIVDWHAAGGTAEQLLQILQQLPDWRPAPPASTMGAVGVHQLHDPSLKHEFLIDGFLDRQGVAMMPGASGSGKTFLVLEMAMCIATGQPFWGMGVKPGLVLYQAGEGKQGVTKRLDAWMLDKGVTPDGAIPFQMLTKRINLFVDDRDTDMFIEEGKRWAAYYDMPVRMAVIDTFNKAITGANEISGQDMTKVLSRMERISVELDCAVLSPIHKSKEGGMRGHTSLKGDVSNVIEVNELNIRDHNQRIIRTVTLDKNKDGEKGKPLRFVLRQVVLGDDEHGKPITTCVVDKPDGDEEEYAKSGKLSLNQILALKALRQAVEDNGQPPPNGLRAGSSIRTVTTKDHWKARFKVTFPNFGSDDPEKREAEAKRILGHAAKVLLAGDYIGLEGEIAWPTGRDDRPKREAKAVEKPSPSPLMTQADLEVPF